MMMALTGRPGFRADAIPAFEAEKFLDHAVFQRMVADDDHSPAGFEVSRNFGQNLFQMPELLINFNPDGLE